MSAPAPKISVIVPNYNHARYIGQRMQSVLEQTRGDFELLYLDDASTDESAQAVAPWLRDPRVRTILNAENSGSPFKQWNKGVREARGELVWIAEADDYADPRLLERLTVCLDAHPKVGVAYCQSQAVDAEGRALNSYVEHTNDLDRERWRADFIADGRAEVSRFLSRKNTLPNASAVVFRRELYLRAGAADETLRFCGDWLLWAKLVALGQVAFVAEHLNFFRSHAGSVTHTSTRNGLEVAEAYFVLGRLIDEGLVQEEDRERARDQLMRRWVQTESETGGIAWRRRAQIFRLARRCDGRAGLRLLRHARRQRARRRALSS